MNLKTFDPSNSQPQKYQGKEPLIALDQNSGLFRINKIACDLLKLSEGTRISFAQDQDKPENWYVSIDNEKGFELYLKPKVTSGLYFSNGKLAKRIAGSVQYVHHAGRVFIRKVSLKHEGKRFWLLDLSSLKNDE